MPLKGASQSAVKRANGATLPTAPTGLLRASGRSAEVLAFEDAVVGYFVEAADLLGVPKSVAAIYGICFASPEPLSFSDIDERLDISSGSISQGLRVLKEVGALKVADATEKLKSGQAEKLTPESNPATDAAAGDDRGSISASEHLSISREGRGARTPRYVPDLELRRLVLHWLEQRLQKQLNSGHGRLAAILKAVPSGENGSVSIVQLRLEALQAWHDKAHGLLPIAKTFLKLT